MESPEPDAVLPAPADASPSGKASPSGNATQSGERGRIEFGVAFAAILVGTLALRQAVPAAESPSLALGGFALASAGWVAAVLGLARSSRSGPRLATVLAGALVLRALLFGADPGLSDDVHRYVWEGALVSEGHSPYTHAPEDPRWKEQRARLPETFAALNHADVPAAYPPATELLCALGVSLGGVLTPHASADRAGHLGVRALFAACDVLVVVALARLCRALGRSPAWALVWGWSPLAAWEFTGASHFDVAGILALVTALALFAPGTSASEVRGARLRTTLASAALGIAVFVKYLPIAALPAVLRRRASDSAAGTVLIVLVFAATLFVLALPFWLFEPSGFGAARGLSSYAFRWESTSLVFRFLEEPLARIFERDESWTDPRRLARFAIGLAWLGAAAWLVLRRAEPWRTAAVLIGLFLVLSPTLHPWYISWIVPFVALRPTAAWLWLCSAGPLLYAPAVSYRNGGSWAEPAWLWPVVALPFFTGLIVDAWRAQPANRV